MKTADFV